MPIASPILLCIIYVSSGYVMSLMYMVPTPVLKSKMSKMVSSSEQGKSHALEFQNSNAVNDLNIKCLLLMFPLLLNQRV